MKIRELLNDESCWCQKAFAMLPDGLVALPEEITRAAKWCIVGAAIVCYPDTDTQEKVIDTMERYTGYDVTAWNDRPERTFQDIQDMLETLDI
jgi:hypothetical protein